MAEILAERAYRKYQYDWLYRHGYSVEDVLNIAEQTILNLLSEDRLDFEGELAEVVNENGLDGELYACYEEFLQSEYQDKDYMLSILDEKDAELYKQFYGEEGGENA